MSDETRTYTHERCGTVISAPRGGLTMKLLHHLLDECPHRYVKEKQ